MIPQQNLCYSVIQAQKQSLKGIMAIFYTFTIKVIKKLHIWSHNKICVTVLFRAQKQSLKGIMAIFYTFTIKVIKKLHIWTHNKICFT